MKAAKYFFGLLVSGLLTAQAAMAQESGPMSARDFVQMTMAPLSKADTPVLYAQCLESRKETTPGGQVLHSYYKHMIFFPLGAAKGTYAVIGWGDGPARPVPQSAADLAVLGSISVGAHVQVATPDQGGPWEHAQEELNGEFLLRQGLKLVYAADFPAAVFAASAEKCPDWDYDSSDLHGVEAFYKRQGWRYDRPSLLPSGLPDAADLARTLAGRHQAVLTVQDVRDLYLKPLQAQGRSALISMCWKAPNTIWPDVEDRQARVKTLAILPKGATQGLIVQFDRRAKNAPIVNFADVSAQYPHKISAIHAAGPWAAAELGANADDLSVQTAAETAPAKLEGVLAAPPKASCQAYAGDATPSTPPSDPHYNGGQLNLQGLADVMLAPLREKHIPVHVAVCFGRYPWNEPAAQREEMILVPQGASRGKLLEITMGAKDRVAQSQFDMLDIALGNRVSVAPQIGVPLPEQKSAQVVSEFLIRHGTRQVAPDDFMSITTQQPSLFCPNWNFERNYPGQLDQIYKDYGWQSPPHL